MMKRGLKRSLLASSATLLIPGFGHAAAPADAEGVVVSAERLDEVGVTRVHTEDSQPASTRSFSAMADRIANLHLDAGGAGSFGNLFVYRGLSNTPYFSDPAVTVYFDDLPLANSFTYPTVLFGFCDVEFARGPQMTAFGRAGQGGILSFLSAQPGASSSVEVRTGVGSYSSRSLALTASTAAGSGGHRSPFDASLAAAHIARDGFIRNTQLDTRVDDQDATAIAARMRWRPVELAEFALQVLANRERNGAQPLVPLSGPSFTVARGREGRTDIDFTGLAFRGAFDSAFGKLTSITSHTDWQLDPYDNRLVLPPPIDSRLTQRQRAWNEELRLASGSAWGLGAWFSNTTTTGGADRTIPDVFPIEASSFTLDSRTSALFGEASLSLTGSWRLSAGLRLEHTQKDFTRANRLVFAPSSASFRANRNFDAVLPKLALTHALSTNTTASASLALGMKPGGWSAYTNDPALAAFDAERTIAFEFAINARMRADTFWLTARSFIYDTRDYQLERSFNASDYLVVNAPRSRSFGTELEAQWRPLTSLEVATSLGTTHVTLREFEDPFTGLSYAGNRAPYTPEYHAYLSATWHTARWLVAGALTSTGRTFFTESQDPIFEQAAHTILGARVGYEISGWRLTLFGENLTDERYHSLIIPGVFHAAPGAPRTWGIELSARLAGS